MARLIYALSLLLIILITRPVHARDLKLEKNIKKIDLKSYVKYYETENIRENPDLVVKKAFKELPKGRLSFSYSNNDFWFKYKIVNGQEKEIRKLFEVNYPVIDELDVYYFYDNKMTEQFNTGDLRPFQSRPLNTRTFVFPINLPKDSKITVLVRVHTQSSVFVPMLLWDSQNFYDQEDKAVFFQGLFYGCMLVMIVYNLFIYFVVRNPSYLYYALFVFSTTIFQATIQGFGFKYIWGDFFWLNTQGLIIFVAFVGLFGALFPIEFLQLKQNKKSWEYKVMYYIAWTSTILIALSFLLPPNIVVRMTSLLALTCPIPAAIIGLRRAARGQQSAQLFSTALLLFFVGTVGLALSRFGLVPSNIITEYGQLVGSTAEVILLSIALANKLNELKSELLIVNTKLQNHIEDVEKIVTQKTLKIRSILKHIKQGIFSLRDGLIVEDESSDYLLAMLNMDKVTGKSLGEVLLNKSQLSSDEKSQICSALDLSMGENYFTFESNADLLPNEIIYNSHQEDLIFELDWEPVINSQGDVESILICIRDVTDMKRLEKINAERQRELEYISEIINVSEMVFAKFIATGKQLIRENMQIIEGKNIYDADSLKLLFLNMHTLKGTSRGYSFKHLSNVIHEVEQYYVEIKVDNRKWNLEKLNQDLEQVMDALCLYQSINENKLGRMTDQEQSYINLNDVETILHELHKLDQVKALDSLAIDVKNKVENILRRIYFVSAKNVIDEIFAACDHLAKDLDKNKPQIRIIDCDFGISSSYEKLFHLVFVHLLRNSISHGIENPEIRKKRHKSPHGSITLEFKVIDDYLEIIYYDDGQGLDLVSIKEKSVKMGVNLPFNVSDSEIAELIFTPGMTTVKNINDISGRGIGMDAIHKYINDYQGSVELLLYGEKRENRYVPFKVRILLPPPHFSFLNGMLEKSKAS